MLLPNMVPRSCLQQAGRGRISVFLYDHCSDPYPYIDSNHIPMYSHIPTLLLAYLSVMAKKVPTPYGFPFRWQNFVDVVYFIYPVLPVLPVLGCIGPLWAISGPPPPPPPHLRGPPRGPAEGFCRGVRVLKRACVGEQTRNLARGFARSHIFFAEIRSACFLLVLLPLVMGRGA